MGAFKNLIKAPPKMNEAGQKYRDGTISTSLFISNKMQ